jgi:lipopolysaccharide/colanic/teichoic acid biosynthesis glycosyltransferase
MNVDRIFARTADVIGAAFLLILFAPAIAVVAAAVKLESPGPAFFRCTRVGRHGREFGMLKFRKMLHGAAGPALTAVDDDRFTRIGSFLARTKLDEMPQLWNVLRGEMSLVGPRPEDEGFVAQLRKEYEPILTVRPGITGLSQLAYAHETEILDPNNRVEDYLSRVMPQKMLLDELYVTQGSILMYLRVLWWTFVTVCFRRDVAVSRATGRLGLRRRPRSLQPEGPPPSLTETQLGGVAR